MRRAYIKIIISQYDPVYLNATRNEYKQVNSNIYVQWVDANLNNTFDIGDELSIKTLNYTDLAGEKIWLIYVPVNTIMAEVSMP